MQAGDLALSPSTLGTLLSNPLGVVESLLEELQTLITCGASGNSPSLIPSIPLSLPIPLSQLLGNLPGVLTGLIGGIGNALGGLLGATTSTSVSLPLTGAGALPVSFFASVCVLIRISVASLTSGAAGAASTVISDGTALLGSLTGGGNTGTGTSTGTGTGAGGAAAAVAGVANTATQAVGNVVNGLTRRAAADLPAPTMALDSPQRYEEMRDFLAFQNFERDEPAAPTTTLKPTPTPTPKPVARSEGGFERVEAYADPEAVRSLFRKYGIV